ncbi:tetratricopeptide repeat protein, partial [Thiohalorhabdus sp.]|uniref:tetratricopeptide repeat protein n=1 Tax=Thiohalorhabdus sp. TaxID=3094134 RepID=UPI002FC3CB1A
KVLGALEVARKLEQAHPRNPQVLTVLGTIHRANDDLESAARTFERLAEYRPQSPQARVELARVYLAQERGKAARETLDKALDMAPDHPPALQLRGRLALADSQPEQARKLGARLGQALPESHAGPLLVARAHQQAGALEAAAEAYRTALERGSVREAALGLFRVRQQQDRGEAARATLRQWLEARPADTEIRTLLAQEQRKSGNPSGAIQTYQKGLDSDPENPVLLNNLAWLYLERDGERAVDLARKAYRLAPDRPGVADTYGWALVQSGEPEKGLAPLRKAAEKAPDRPLMRYHLAAALADSGRDDEARRQLTDLLKEAPDFPKAAAARSLLESLAP